MVVSKSDQDRAQLRDDVNTINTEVLLSHLRCDLWLVLLALVSLHAESVREEVPLASSSKGKSKDVFKKVGRKSGHCKETH